MVPRFQLCGNCHSFFDSLEEIIFMELLKSSVSLIFWLGVLFFGNFVKEVETQNVITSCRDRLIMMHDGGTRSYCNHACGSGFMCTQQGDCICTTMNCVNNVPVPITLAPELCAQNPPPPGPPVNNFLRNMCNMRCAMACPMGTGVICHELPVFTVMNPNTFARVCTCICPLQQCPPTPVTTVRPVNIVTVPLLYPWIALKKILKKIWKKGILIFKTLYIVGWVVLKVALLELLLLAPGYFLISYFMSIFTFDLNTPQRPGTGVLQVTNPSRAIAKIKN